MTILFLIAFKKYNCSLNHLRNLEFRIKVTNEVGADVTGNDDGDKDGESVGA